MSAADADDLSPSGQNAKPELPATGPIANVVIGTGENAIEVILFPSVGNKPNMITE